VDKLERTMGKSGINFKVKSMKVSKEEETKKADISEVIDLIKGGKRAAIGEKRIHGGVEKIKTAQGWVPTGKSKSKKEDNKESKGKFYADGKYFQTKAEVEAHVKAKATASATAKINAASGIKPVSPAPKTPKDKPKDDPSKREAPKKEKKKEEPATKVEISDEARKKMSEKAKEAKARSKAKSAENKKKINAITDEILAEGKTGLPQPGATVKTLTLSDTVYSEHLKAEVRLRGLATGKPSKELYKSPEGSNVNLVDSASFGKASQAIQKDLNSMLFETEVVLDSLGVEMKKPIDFVCQNINAVKNTQATFTPLKQAPLTANLNDRIDIKDRSSGLQKSLVHEIGHAIDFSMNEEGKTLSLFSQINRESKGQSRKDFDRLNEIIKEAPFYKDRSDKSYLTDPSEVFARAFEVHAYNKALKLNKEGKISDDFVNSYHPDFLKGSKKEAGMDAMNAQKTIDMLKEKGFKKESKEFEAQKKEYETNVEKVKGYRAKMNDFFSAQNAGTNTPADVEAGRKNKTRRYIYHN